MVELIELAISQSSDIVHIGDEFLLYLKVRNPFPIPVKGVGVSYDLPKGFFIKKTEPEAAAQDWGARVIGAIIKFFHEPNFEESVFEKKRTMSWKNVEILPNETYTITIPLRVGAFFPRYLKADTYHLVFDFTYGLGDQNIAHSQQIRTDIIVYSHEGYIFAGAIAGGIIGAFIRKPSSISLDAISPSLIPDIILGILTGIVLIVVFKRKSNVQSFIAVEDFWGGFLVGIVGGYGGQELISRYIGSQALP